MSAAQIGLCFAGHCDALSLIGAAGLVVIDNGDGTLKLNVFSESVHTDDLRLVECPQLLSSTETIRLIRDRELGTPTSTFHTGPEL